MKWIREGPDLPKVLPSDRGLTQSDYPDAVRAAKELVRNAGTDVSLLKNQTKSLEKMLDLGGLSTFV